MRKVKCLIILVIILSGCTMAAAGIRQPAGLSLATPTLAATETPTATTPAATRQPTVAATLTETRPPTARTPTLTSTPIPSVAVFSSTPTQSPTPGPTATLSPDAWMRMPVVPASVSEKACQIYKLGQMLGNDPRAFSKVGDCQSMLPNFLGDFDAGRYDLGPYTDLQPVIDYFSGSFGRNSRATKDGLSAGGAVAVLWNDWKDCGQMETPLDCEYRIHRPSFAIISLGTNDAYGYAPFETTLRRVIDITIGHGVVPILATKADNAEGDYSYNAIIARLAYEYDIPLWNFWLAIQPLPNHGMRSLEHLTFGEFIGPADFSSPENLQYAFNVRNLTALQILDVAARGCNGPLPVTTPRP